jgi:hypothetical protein
MFFIYIGITVLAVWGYLLIVRPIISQKYPELFAKLDEVEKYVIDRSRTLLVSRGYVLGGALLFIHDQLASAGFDWTPIVDQFATTVPPSYRALVISLFMIITGAVFEWLRRKTTQPLANKEPTP